MILLSSNNATSNLASGISSGTTTIVLTTGTGALFPSPGANEYFTLTLNDVATGLVYEVCWCIARTGDSLTVSRGQEGTTATSWIIGDFAYNANTEFSIETGRAFAAENVPTLPFTIPAAHQGVTQFCGSTGTITLPATSGIPSGYLCSIVCASPSAAITIDTNSATVILPTGSVTSTFTLTGLTSSVILQWSVEASAWISIVAQLPNGGFPRLSDSVAISTVWAGTSNGYFISTSAGGTTQTVNTAAFSAGQTIGFIGGNPMTVTLSSGTFFGGALTGQTSVSLATGSWIAMEWDGIRWRIFAASPDILGYLLASHMGTNGGSFVNGTGSTSTSASFTPVANGVILITGMGTANWAITAVSYSLTGATVVQAVSDFLSNANGSGAFYTITATVTAGVAVTIGISFTSSAAATALGFTYILLPTQ